MDKEKLKRILAEHEKWLKGEDGANRANLWDANLRDADLRHADLRGANLRAANLRHADLRHADLRGAKGAIIGPQRTDGYRFDLSQGRNGRWVVVAGCRRMSLKKYRDHVRTYDCEGKRAETTAILDYLEARLRQVKKTKKGKK